MRCTIPAELSPASVVAIIDSREQLPLDLSPLQVVTGTLAVGVQAGESTERVAEH